MISTHRPTKVKTGVTTYNTGKVEIGKHYVPPRRYESSLDMDRLQDALLRRPGRFPLKSAVIYGFLLAAVGVLYLLR